MDLVQDKNWRKQQDQLGNLLRAGLEKIFPAHTNLIEQIGLDKPGWEKNLETLKKLAIDPNVWAAKKEGDVHRLILELLLKFDLYEQDPDFFISILKKLPLNKIDFSNRRNEGIGNKLKEIKQIGSGSIVSYIIKNYDFKVDAPAGLFELLTQPEALQHKNILRQLFRQEGEGFYFLAHRLLMSPLWKNDRELMEDLILGPRWNWPLVRDLIIKNWRDDPEFRDSVYFPEGGRLLEINNEKHSQLRKQILKKRLSEKPIATAIDSCVRFFRWSN